MQLLEGHYADHAEPNDQCSVLHLSVIREVDVEPGQSLPACTKPREDAQRRSSTYEQLLGESIHSTVAPMKR
jgi:hypothetical protein